MTTTPDSHDDAAGTDAQTVADEQFDPQGIDQQTVARAGVYTVLATLLDEPDESVYAQLESGDVDATVRDLLDATGLDVEPPNLTVEVDHDTLCARFNDLFTVGYAEYTDRTDGSLNSEGPRISLYETSYRPEAAWNDVNLDLARAYEYFGLEIDQSERDNHDYLPYQLEFAGYLARLESSGSEDVARARLDLHDRHLHVVAGGLADRMAELSVDGLYSELAAFLDRFVTADQQDLADRFEGGGDP
ncbi:chaperone protein [Haloferax elongans ATCC BAA-1513]|uniref:Chaperone protein n=1 Tax=Haloferax elongans ATCC BAA-1513 TaxID=1230453 RepID=M0HLE3_HALEO|nr:molecular chaperone TorD family protein [Haloferax elongans]ELZ84608.1 chaperone protein [Haloferax elongans ATCC BAA-1513]